MPSAPNAPASHCSWHLECGAIKRSYRFAAARVRRACRRLLSLLDGRSPSKAWQCCRGRVAELRGAAAWQCSCGAVLFCVAVLLRGAAAWQCSCAAVLFCVAVLLRGAAAWQCSCRVVLFCVVQRRHGISTGLTSSSRQAAQARSRKQHCCCVLQQRQCLSTAAVCVTAEMALCVAVVLHSSAAAAAAPPAGVGQDGRYARGAQRQRVMRGWPWEGQHVFLPTCSSLLAQCSHPTEISRAYLLCQNFAQKTVHNT